MIFSSSAGISLLLLLLLLLLSLPLKSVVISVVVGFVRSLFLYLGFRV